MNTLILVHVMTGLVGIASGTIAVAGVFFGMRVNFFNALFLFMTAVACVTGFIFLPAVGVTSAQLVAFFLTFLLLVAAYARYVQRLNGSWNQIYAFTIVGALFLDVLITAAQSFLHVSALKEIAPTQNSPVYVAVKITLLVVFIAVALLTAKRAGRS